MQPELTICTGTRHRRESLVRFLNSAIRAATVPTRIIVADASDEFEPFQTAGFIDDTNIVSVELYHESPRLGVVKGYNRAFRRASTPFVAWMNDDCEMIPGWDRIALDFMNRWPEVGMGLVYFTMDTIHRPKSPDEIFHVQMWHSMYAANFGVVRREVGDQVGWFDEREVYVEFLQRTASLEMYGCDNSITFSIIDAGLAVVPIPGCRVHHHREQDAERAANMRTHLVEYGGRLSGIILDTLWNSDGRGYERLQKKAARFDYLKAPIRDS